MATGQATITVGETNSSHLVGNEDCDEGWCDGVTFPRIHEGCEAKTPGLVHAEFGDENYDGDYWLFTKCDICGERE